MPRKAQRFDAQSVREEWDAAANAYADAQATGLDIYRLALFGPAQIELCANVRGLRLLDVGCGAGYFAREMARRGAVVTGVDLSPAMLEYATENESRESLGIRYVAADAARLLEHFEKHSFDMVTSCLALQDMPEVSRVLGAIREVLIPGGRLVISIAHPCTDTPFRQWAMDESGRKQWLCIDRYFDRGPVTYDWKGWAYEFSTSALHATLEDWLSWLFGSGFRLRALREPKPSDADIAKHADLEDAARIPYFLLLDLERAE